MSIVLIIDWGSVDDRALRERVLKSRSMRPTSERFASVGSISDGP
jgi:hypothetical protein